MSGLLKIDQEQAVSLAKSEYMDTNNSESHLSAIISEKRDVFDNSAVNSYDFAAVRNGYDACSNISDDDQDDDDSLELEEGDSVFESGQECSSLSVSDSECEQKHGDSETKPRLDPEKHHILFQRVMTSKRLQMQSDRADLCCTHGSDSANKCSLCPPMKNQQLELWTQKGTIERHLCQEKESDAVVDISTSQIDWPMCNNSSLILVSREEKKACHKQSSDTVSFGAGSINHDDTLNEGLLAVSATSGRPCDQFIEKTALGFHSHPAEIDYVELEERCGSSKGPPDAVSLKSSSNNNCREDVISVDSSEVPTNTRPYIARQATPLSPTSCTVSSGVNEGMTLNREWINRVQKAISANSEKTVSATSEDLMKSARNCKLMERFSDKQNRGTTQPADKLIKIYPLDSCQDGGTERHTNCNNRSFKKRTDMYSCTASNPLYFHLESPACERPCGHNLTQPMGSSMHFLSCKNAYVNDADSNLKKVDLCIASQLKPETQFILHKDLLTPKCELCLACKNSTEYPRPPGIHASVYKQEDEVTHTSSEPSEIILQNDIKDNTRYNLLNGVMGSDEVFHGESINMTLHLLNRKPAIRRKGFAWIRTTSLPGNTDKRLTYGLEDGNLGQGASLELAPSLLNLFDHRIATGEKDKDTSDDHINDKKVSKTRSLPSQPVQDHFDEVQYRSEKMQFPKLPAERPVSMMDRELITPKGSLALFDNKKRPLSISSVSSTSLTSSPRLRKKRSNPLSSDNSDSMRGNRQDSDSTLIPDCRPDSRVMSTSESRQSVDSGCIEGEKNGDRYPDSVSVTSSDTGSCKDDTDTSAKDCSLVSPPVNKRNSAPLLRHARGSDASSPLSASPTDHTNNSISATCTGKSPETPNPNRYAKYFASLEQTNNSNSPSEIHSFDINSERSSSITSDSPANTCASQNSSSRQEARMKFFANYEDHTKQSFPPPVSIVEENSELSSSPLAASPNDTPIVPQPSSQASSPAAITEADNHQASPAHIPFHKNTPSPTSAVLKPESRRDRSSQLSPTSEKASRRSERLGSVSKHERRSTSPRPGFSRVSKKKDSHAPSDSGSKSSPVYVSYVSRVVTEIIESERVYIASLKDIIHGYLEPMEKLLDSEEAKKDVACLFSNIRDIYTFGCTFLSDLEAAGADPVKVAQCFVKYNKGFVIYTDYCTNYPRAVEVLTRFMQHPALSKLCKERQHSLGHALPLGAYLLKPVQRILKYHLLLHNIVKNCEKDQEEAAILEKAFHHMTQMAHHINEMKRKHEHAVRIQEIQSQLEDYVGEDLTRLGELVLEGSFKVNGAKASRQVFLFEKGLLISKLKEGGMLSCKTFIPCSNLMLIEMIPNDPLSFHIIPFDNPRAQDTLQARNMEQKRRWCHDIKKQILESFKGRIPDNAKNLIMQLGKDWDDDYLSKDNLDGGKRNQHNAPEYLEKRRFRRKSGSRLPDFSLLIPQKTKKGGNKKNEIWSEEKRSLRRSESRSPERHRRIFSKQNSATKSRSRSISSSSISLPTSPFNHLPDQSATELKYAETKSVSKTVENLSPKSQHSKSACPSPESPVYRKSPKKLIYSKDGMDAIETEDNIEKRPVSFLMAKANSILSDDITNLLARCGGNLKILNSPSLLNEQYGDLPDVPKLGMRNTFDNPEELLDNNDNKKVHCSDAVLSQPLSEVNNAPCSETSKHISKLSETIASSQKNGKESEQLKSKLISSLDPRSTASANSSDKTKGEHKEGNKLQSNPDLNDLEKVYENLLMTEGHMSRRGTLNSPNLTQKCKSEVTIENEMERWRKEYGMMDPGVISKKNVGENILLTKKGLRLPNTSKLLSARENELNLYKHKMRHKMTSSEETLNTGCVRDMNERPLFIKSVHSSSKLPLSVARRPCNLDLAEYTQVSVNKENHLLDKNISTPLHQCSDRKEDLANEMKYLSQISYATPPRDYMTVEKMKRADSLKDTSRPGFLSQNVGDNFFSHTTSGAVSALSISPVAVTAAKPVSFTTSNLLRSKSTPISSQIECSVAKVSSKERPVSMDVDKLTEESNKLIAEMEEYISNSCENVKSMNKFPTSLSAISAEEEEPRSNRLSMVSTISTSSYESQGSSSSDGLVGTLKSKLRAWARMRNDSEYSYPSALTSDDEEQEQTHSESSSALGLHAKNMSSCRDDSDYDTALLEDTYSEPVPYLEQPSTSLATEKIVSSKHEEYSERESYLQRGSAITDSFTCEDSSFVQPHSCDDSSYSELHRCDNLSITGSCSCGGFICESHPHEDASIAELQPCEDDDNKSQLYEDASIAELQPCEDDDSKYQLYENASIAELQPCEYDDSQSQLYEDASTAELQQCEDDNSKSHLYEHSLSDSHPCHESCIPETHSYRDYVSESHPCKDSSITQLQPCEDYVCESQLCDNSLCESQPCEGSSVSRLYPCDNSSICESHQQKKQESINFDGVDVTSKTSLKRDRQPEQIQFCHLSTSEAKQPSSANNNDIVQFCDPNFNFQCNQWSTHNARSSNIKIVPKNEHLLEESSTVKGAPAEHLTEVVKPVKENSFFGTSDYHEQCVFDKDYGDKETPTEGSLESKNKICENVDKNEEEDVDVEYPKRSIRDFVQNFEEKQRAESQKVLEVKRREPGVMIRQRLKSLRESTLHGWRNSSPPDEQHQLEHCNFPLPTHLSEISNGKCNDQRDTTAASSCTTLLHPRNSLSKSVADLCKSQENIHLSGTCLNSRPSTSYSRHSIPFCNMISTSQYHGNDICEFHYNTSENQASSGNQFIHRVQNGSHQSVSRVHSSLEPPSLTWTQNGLDASVSLPEIFPSLAPIEAASMQSSNPASVLDDDDESEEENLVKMKGWVRALISKFQDKDSV